MRFFLVVTTLALAVSCGGSKSPATPTPTPVTLTGFVFHALLGPTARVAGARVEIFSGTGAGRVTTSDNQGAYRFENLERGSLTLRVSSAGFVTRTQFVSINGDVEADVSLSPDRVTASGITVDALTGARLGNVTITGGESLVTSDGSGAFTVTTASSTTVVTPLIFSSPFTVERRTSLRLPGPESTVSLLSATFDLAAFNQMFRAPSLQRWTTAPPVVLEMRAATFVDRNADDVTLNDIVMSDAEATSILSDLTRALPQLSGGKFTAFASVGRQTSAAGSTFHLLNSGVITVIRATGMDRIAGVIGLAQILRFTDGTIVGGMIILDHDWDRSNSPFVFSVRAHELGHNLGMEHVTLRNSVMHPTADIHDILPFDRDAARVAYQRPPGNRAPDVDPEGSPSNPLGGIATWGPRIR